MLGGRDFAAQQPAKHPHDLRGNGQRMQHAAFRSGLGPGRKKTGAPCRSANAKRPALICPSTIFWRTTPSAGLSGGESSKLKSCVLTVQKPVLPEQLQSVNVALADVEDAPGAVLAVEVAAEMFQRDEEGGRFAPRVQPA